MDWCGRVGEVREAFRGEFCTGVEWKVPKISSMPDKLGPAYFSPDFKFLDSIWYLSIYRFDKEWIGLGILRKFQPPSESVRFSIGLLKRDGTKQLMYCDWTYPERCHSLSLDKLLHADILLRGKAQLAPSDVLTVTCALWRSIPLPEEDNWLSFSGQKRDNRIVWSACKERNDKDDNWLSFSGQKRDNRMVWSACTELDDKDGKTLVSRGTQTEVSGNGDGNVEFARHDAEGVPRKKETGGAWCPDGKKAEHVNLSSKEIEKLRQRFRQWLQQPQEGRRIRILRREHFEAKKGEKLPDGHKR